MSSCCQISDGISLLDLSNLHNDSLWHDKQGTWGSVFTWKTDSRKKMNAPFTLWVMHREEWGRLCQVLLGVKAALLQMTAQVLLTSPCPLIPLLNFSLLLSNAPADSDTSLCSWAGCLFRAIFLTLRIRPGPSGLCSLTVLTVNLISLEYKVERWKERVSEVRLWNCCLWKWKLS